MSSVTLKLEHIGSNYDRNPDFYRRELDRLRIGSYKWKKLFFTTQKNRTPWVAEITGVEPSGRLIRSFVNSNKDYASADMFGERGIYFVFHLFTGSVYEVRHFTDWNHEERYFCIISNHKVIRITKEAACKIAKERKSRNGD